MTGLKKNSRCQSPISTFFRSQLAAACRSFWTTSGTEAMPFQDFDVPGFFRPKWQAGILRFLQPDRTIARVNRKQVSTPVDFSVDTFLTQASIDRQRNVGCDVPIAGMHVEVSGKIGRHFQGNASV